MTIASTHVSDLPPDGRFDPGLTGAVRRPKAGDLLARRLVRGYRGLPDGVTHHMEMLHTFKKAYPKLGITQRALALYDYLFCLTGAQDWHRDRLALVWPSNDRLLADLAICDVSFLKKLFRQLRGLGLIDYKDSPTRQRYGRRHPDGTIDYPNSFGIVLNSIAGLHADFKALATEAVVERRYRKAVQRAISGARRERDDLLCAAADLIDADAFAARRAVFDALDAEIADSGRDYALKEALVTRYRTALDTLIRELAADTESPISQFAVHDAVEVDRMASYRAPDSPPTGGREFPSIRDITAPPPHSRNRLGDKSSDGESATQRSRSDRGGSGHGEAGATSAGGGLGAGVADGPQSSGAEGLRARNAAALAKRLSDIRAGAEVGEASGHTYEPAKISMRQVRAALPPALRVGMRDDWGPYQIYDHLRDAFAEAGVSVQLLDEARLLMGRDRACACAAVILAKRGELRSADAYLCGLMAKYRDGALRIERSLFGIIAERKKALPETRKLPL